METRNPLAIVTNDWHIDLSNVDIVKSIIKNMITDCVENDVNTVILAGDMLDSRSSQKLPIMAGFMDILNMFHKANINVYAIRGNHDSPIYSEYKSWLTPFKNHPSLTLYEDFTVTNIHGKTIAFLPFFEEEMMVDKLKGLPKVDILIGHLELNGSVSNAGLVMKDKAISKSMLKNATITLLGHYHNPCVVGSGIHHMPSLYQRNFGENNIKGWTVLYDDLTIEHRQSKFKPYETFTLNVEDNISNEIKDIIELSESGEINIRVKLEGSEEKVSTFNRKGLKEAGVSLVSDYDEIILSEDGNNIEIKSMNKEEVKELFIEFCEEKGHNVKEGEKYLV